MMAFIHLSYISRELDWEINTISSIGQRAERLHFKFLFLSSLWREYMAQVKDIFSLNAVNIAPFFLNFPL
jgi:hypothetical protein